MERLVPFVERSFCGYKRSAITVGPKFYWTNALPWSNIEVVPRTSPSPNRVAMTGPSPHDAQSATWSRLDRLTDATLRRVTVCIAGALVTTGVVLAATNTGSEQHTWWGWLLIGAPLTWLSFIAMVALTFGALRIIVAVLRSPVSRSAARHAMTSTVKFLRAGYPQGVPTIDTFPLLAVLPQTATR